uniref:Dual specificity protein kinase TTK n=1 Tax=Lygus hesperus TaxID=30085 RepID=A0A0A9Z106_LYGHE
MSPGSLLRPILGPARKVFQTSDDGDSSVEPPEVATSEEGGPLVKRHRKNTHDHRSAYSTNSGTVQSGGGRDAAPAGGDAVGDGVPTPNSNGYITTGNGERVFFVRQKKYLELERLGSGGSSQVYKVMDDKKQIFALKRIVLHRSTTAHKQHQDSGKQVGKEDGNHDDVEQPSTSCVGGHIAEYRNEIALLQKMKGKPNIIQLITYEEVSETIVHILLEAGSVDLNAIFK